MPTEAVTRLIVVRHGETEWNLAGREMGHLDSPLTERGLRQAHAIAARLSKTSFTALYTSDLGRALQTAAVIEVCCGVKPRPTRRLRERHMGVLQGLDAGEVSSRFPELASARQTLGYYDAIPEGETAAERQTRCVRTFDEIADRHPGEIVVVVTHAGLASGMLEFVLGLPFGTGRRFRKDHGSFNEFERRDRDWRLVTWNDTSHLDQL